MNPTTMAEKWMFPTLVQPIWGRAGCGESRTSGSVRGMARTSRSDSVTGGAVPTLSRKLLTQFGVQLDVQRTGKTWEGPAPPVVRQAAPNGPTLSTSSRWETSRG